MGAALGLCALTRVVDDKGVDERRIGQKGIRETVCTEANPFTRQPFQGAVFAHVDDGISPPAPFV